MEQLFLGQLLEDIIFHRIGQLVYVAYVQRTTPTYILFGISMILLDMYAYIDTCIKMTIYKNFLFFLALSYNFILFENLLLYFWPLIYLFFLGRGKFIIRPKKFQTIDENWQSPRSKNLRHLRIEWID